MNSTDATIKLLEAMLVFFRAKKSRHWFSSFRSDC